jgi:hypothetical protein
MGYRFQEKQAGSFAAEIAKRRGAYDNLNIDPYAGKKIGPGNRQENWKDILAHGERSDTDWNQVFRDSTQAVRRNYAPKGDWAKRGKMDDTSKNLFDLAWGRGTAEEKSINAAKFMAEYNKNENVHERIGVSETKVRNRAAYQNMQIRQQKTQRRKTRDTLKRGTSGLSVNFGRGAGAGLAL